MTSMHWRQSKRRTNYENRFRNCPISSGCDLPSYGAERLGFSRTKTTPSCRSQRVHAESARIRPDSIRSAHRVPKAISLLKLGLDRVCDSGRGQMFHPLFSQLQAPCFAWRLCTFGSRLDFQPKLSPNAQAVASQCVIWRFFAKFES